MTNYGCGSCRTHSSTIWIPCWQPSAHNLAHEKARREKNTMARLGRLGSATEVKRRRKTSGAPFFFAQATQGFEGSFGPQCGRSTS
jgi:hypothetical protein